MRNKLYQEVKVKLVRDYLDCCECMRTAEGCYSDRGLFYEGTADTFIRKGARFDVTKGQVYRDSKPSSRVKHQDVMSIAPDRSGLWVLRRGGIINMYNWRSQDVVELKATKRTRELINFQGHIVDRKYMDSATLAAMMQTVGVRAWETSDMGKELAAAGWGRKQVRIISTFV